MQTFPSCLLPANHHNIGCIVDASLKLDVEGVPGQFGLDETRGEVWRSGSIISQRVFNTLGVVSLLKRQSRR